MYLGIQAINPELLNNTNELLRQRKTYQEIEASLIDVVDQLEFVRNLNRDLGASVDLIREGMRELNNTDLDNEFTKIAQGIGDIEKRYRQFLIEVDRSGSEFTDTALTLSGLEMPDTVATTFAENLTDAGSESIRTILNTADNLDVEILDRDAINAIVAEIEKIENIRLDTSDEARDTATEVKEAKKEAMSALGALLKTAQGIRGLLGLGTATKEVENLFILAVKREATQKTNLSIYKEQNNQLKLQLQTSQKILDIENKLVKVTGPFASATKAIFELSKKTSQIQLGVLQTENKLAAIQDKKVLLNAQLAAEQSKSAEDQNQHLIEYLQAQISANEDLGQEQRKSAKQELQSQLDILGAEQQAVQVQQDAIKLALTEGDILKDNQQVTKAMLMAEQMRLDEQTKVISSLKEQLRIRREIEDINRSSARAGREAEAERLGLKIPSQIAQAEDSAIRLQRLQEDRDGINGQQSLLEMERDAAIKKIELEKLALEIQMQASKTALQASNLELEIAAKKAEELDLTDQANKARDIIAANDTTIGAITENESLIDSFYEGTIERENALFDARKSKLDAQIEAEEAAGDRIATTIEQRFQEAMTRLGMGGRMDMASFGLTGGARDFFQTEAGGILTNTDLTDEEKAAQIDQVKEMASQLETAQMAAEGFGAIMNTVQSSIEGAFMSIIDGSKEAGEAFADMAKAILKQIIQMIIKMLVFKAIEAGLNFVSPGAGTLLVGGLKGTGGIMQANPMASGGVMQAQAYASGGVLSRRDRNEGVIKQPTYLVGEGRYNEAVVPLPNGRAIPVQMHGGQSSQQNNISVNINMDSSGNTQTQTDGADMQNLGALVATAVQKELVAQKMPGGILNKYGVA
jgi:hypothetical protein